MPMPIDVSTFVSIVIAVAAVVAGYGYVRKLRRGDYIRTYMFPPGLLAKLRNHYPAFAAKEEQLVARALRRFFLAYLHGGRRQVAMPSQVADVLWHEFILYTRHYQLFCRNAFGGFLHHSPAVVLSRSRDRNAGLRRTWWHSCLDENINPRKATRLPLLFALDSKLGVGDGYRYTLDCRRETRGDANDAHCASDFCDLSFDGSTEGFGDSGSDAGGDGCGGGCGGD